MKVVKLTPAALRTWRVNQPLLVRDNGEVARRIDAHEERAISDVVRQSRAQRRSLDLVVKVPPLPGEKLARSLHIQTTYHKGGLGESHSARITVKVDHFTYTSSREVLARDMLARYGECQIRHPNGIILKTVRDPQIKRPSFKDSLRTAPHPDHCPCRDWGAPHPGTHHAICPSNRLAPPDQQAPSTVVSDEELSALPPEALPKAVEAPGAQHTLVDSPVVQDDPLDAPEACRNECTSWALPAGTSLEPHQHHPMCVFYQRWKVKTAISSEAQWIVDLTTSERIRLATPDEVAQAELSYRRTGASIVQIDERAYAVIAERDLKEPPTVSEHPPPPELLTSSL